MYGKKPMASTLILYLREGCTLTPRVPAAICHCLVQLRETLVNPEAPMVPLNKAYRHWGESSHFIRTIRWAAFVSWFLFCPLSASLCDALKVLTYCAGLSGTNHPAFLHVSFKGMAHAQFAVSKIILFVSTVSSLPNRKCNSAPPGAPRAVPRQTFCSSVLLLAVLNQAACNTS